MMEPSSSTKDSSPLWVVVADGRQARLYRIVTTTRVRTPPGHGAGQYRHQSETLASKLELLDNGALDADLLDLNKVEIPSRHTTTPYVDTKDEVKAAFARAIVKMLEEGSKQRHYAQLIVAAPPRMLGAMRKQMNPHITKKILAEFPEDLTGRSEQALFDHIKEALPAGIIR